MECVSGVKTYQNYNNPRPHAGEMSFKSRNSYYDYQVNDLNNGNDAQKTIFSVGLLQLASLFLDKASKWCGDKLMRGKEFTSFENVANVAKRMVTDNKLNVSVAFINKNNINKFPEFLKPDLIPVANGRNAFFMDSVKLAVAPEKKPSLILHELGHAINASKGKFLRFLQNSRRYRAYVPSAVVLANNMFKESGFHSDFIEKHAGAIGFLSFLPTIIEEGLASLRGVNAAKKVLGKTANLAPLKRNYFTAWLTYLIAGLGVGVASKFSVLTNKDGSGY